MNIYLVEWPDASPDNFDAYIVIAKSPENAINLRPDGWAWEDISRIKIHTWPTSKDSLIVTKIGTADLDDREYILLTSWIGV